MVERKKATRKVPTRQAQANSVEEVHEIWSEIGVLRDGVSELNTAVAAMTVKADSQSSKMDSIAQAVQRISDNQQRAAENKVKENKTPWGNLISVSAVMLTLVVSLGSGALAPVQIALGYHETQITENDKRSAERQLEVLTLIQELDDTLQREMRDLDQVQKVRIDNLDKVLQREMELLVAIGNAKRESLTERIDALKAYVEPELAKYNAAHVRYAERVARLEALLDKVIREQESRTDKVYDKSKE